MLTITAGIKSAVEFDDCFVMFSWLNYLLDKHHVADPTRFVQPCNSLLFPEPVVEMGPEIGLI